MLVIKYKEKPQNRKYKPRHAFDSSPHCRKLLENHYLYNFLSGFRSKVFNIYQNELENRGKTVKISYPRNL